MSNSLLLNHFERARDWIERSHYCSELEHFRGLHPEQVTRLDFFEAYVAVVLGTGYKWSIVEGLYPQFKQAFMNYVVDAISNAPRDMRVAALNVFGHERKIEAVISTAQRLAREDWEQFKVNLTGAYNLDFMDSLPYIGTVTKYEVAKNIGLDYGKPDRRLCAIAGKFGYNANPSGVFMMISVIRD